MDAVDRLVVKLAQKVVVRPHVRATPRGGITAVEGYTREAVIRDLMRKVGAPEDPSRRSAIADLIERHGSRGAYHAIPKAGVVKAEGSFVVPSSKMLKTSREEGTRAAIEKVRMRVAARKAHQGDGANYEIRDAGTGEVLARTKGTKLDAIAERQRLQKEGHLDAWVFPAEPDYETGVIKAEGVRPALPSSVIRSRLDSMLADAKRRYGDDSSKWPRGVDARAGSLATELAVAEMHERMAAGVVKAEGYPEPMGPKLQFRTPDGQWRDAPPGRSGRTPEEVIRDSVRRAKEGQQLVASGNADPSDLVDWAADPGNYRVVPPETPPDAPSFDLTTGHVTGPIKTDILDDPRMLKLATKMGDIRTRYLKAKERYDDLREADARRYGTPGSTRGGPPIAGFYAPKVFRAKLDAARKAMDREGQKMMTLLDEVSPPERQWRSGVPVWWIMEKLTFDDATTRGELSVVPPQVYGGSEAFSREFARALR